MKIVFVFRDEFPVSLFQDKACHKHVFLNGNVDVYDCTCDSFQFS